MRRAPFFLVGMLGFWSVSNGQPALTLGMDTKVPGERAIISIQYDGTGTTVDRIAAEIGVDDDLFTSATVLCGLPFRCFRNNRGNLMIVGSGIPTGVTQVGGAQLSLSLSAPPGRHVVPIIAEAYEDVGGTNIPGTGSTSGLVDVIVPPPLTAMSRSRTGRGTALIFPYFTVRGRQSAVFSVANLSPRPKALRVNVLEGLNGRIVGSWNSYLPSADAVRFRVDPIANSGGAVVRGGGCNLPELPTDGLMLDPTSYGNDPGPDSPARLLEGFVEVIVMADLDNAAAAELAADCTLLTSRFDRNNTWDLDPTVDTLDVFGEIAGVVSQRGLRGTVGVDYPATAIRGFSSANLHADPTTVVDLNSGNNMVTLPSFNDGGKGNIIVLPDTLTYPTSIEAVSALLMQDRVRLPVFARGTEWIFSFPTKPYFTDPAVAIGPPPVDPFSSVLSTTGACETATINVLSQALSVMRDLCFATSTVSFDRRNLFDSQLGAVGVDVNASAFATALFDGTLTDQDNTRTLRGLPVVGFAVPFQADRSPRSQRVDLRRGTGQKGAMAESAGRSVFVRGRLVFVGIPGADGGRGEVLIYRRHGTVLVPETTLVPPPEFNVASFGASLDFDNDLLGVGAPGVPPMGAKGVGTMQGAVYQRLFNGQWNIKFNWNDVVDDDDAFGASVAIEGDMIAFGAPGDDSVEDGGGAAYLFDVDGNSIATALPTGNSLGTFGQTMTMKNGILAIGSPGANGPLGSAMGAMNMYDAISTNLSTPLSTQFGQNAGDNFGASIALAGDMIAIGSPGMDGESGDQQGAVLTYDFDGGALTFSQQIAAASAGATGGFGTSLGLNDSGELVIGAPGSIGGESAGSIYVYSELEAEYTQLSQVSAEEPGLDSFGASVDIDGEDIIIGAPDAEGNAGAAILISESEVLFFDNFETMLFDQ